VYFRIIYLLSCWISFYAKYYYTLHLITIHFVPCGYQYFSKISTSLLTVENAKPNSRNDNDDDDKDERVSDGCVSE